MRCAAFVPKRPYSPPGPCRQTRGVRLVRWAPTPLTTRVLRGLCRHHEKQLHRGTLTLVAIGVAA